jgi:hypothetical protein
MGDQNCVNVWSTLGTAQIWKGMSLHAYAKLPDAEKLPISRYMSFRSQLATLYHTTPPGRRYGLHIYFAAFYHNKWGKGPMSGTRRANCAMLLAELLADPSKYPSLKLPRSLPAKHAEMALGQHFKHAIKRGAVWTIAEDRAFREALKAFAAANGKAVEKTQQVRLPNKLVVHLDPETDNERFRAKRDAWVKERFDKAKK